MFYPKHTAFSVTASLGKGLIDGSISMEAEELLPEPILERENSEGGSITPSIFSFLLLPDRDTLVSFVNTIKAGFALKVVLTGAFTLFLGNVRKELFTILLVGFTINYFTGVIAQRGESDNVYKGYMGIYRQAGLLLILIVGNLLEKATDVLKIPIKLVIASQTVTVTDFFAVYLLFQCLQEIITNLDKSGVPIPQPIKQIIKKAP